MKKTVPKKRDVEITEFPIGARVELPTGVIGTVIGHVGLSEKAIERCVVRYDPGITNHFRINDDTVVLPKHLKKFQRHKK